MLTRNIEYRIDDKRFVGYLADGSNGRKTAGVLVAHEGGGMTEHPKERARMLAELGYVAFAMDTFGETIKDRAQAMAIIGALTNDLTTLRRRACVALDVLKAQANVDSARTAAIGFCFGGTTVLELARSGADVGCVVGFHSGLATIAHGNAGHSFTNREVDAMNIPGFAYHAPTDERSWQAMRNFFDEVIRAV